MPGLRILRAGPGATIQDDGRFHYRRYGVTPAGPMDWVAFRTANLALGNARDAAVIEIALGGIELKCEETALQLAFCGGAFQWQRNGKPLPCAMRLALQPGETLSAKPGAWGAFA
ncbi:MAG TPA: allophanate hydrolase subunit 2 family protein, partial [Methylovirgula sp.]